MEDASWVKRRMFLYFMDLARRVGANLLDGRPVSGRDRFRYALGKLIVYDPLRNALGMSRVRVAYTAGEAIGPDLFVFYRSLGINLKQLYGSTETSVMVCVQPNGEVKARHRGAADEGRGAARARQRRDRAAMPRLFPRVLQERRRHAGSEGLRGLVPHRRRGLLRRGRATSRSSIARRTWASSPTARSSPRSTSRTS
jgi:hypothetical protein